MFIRLFSTAPSCDIIEFTVSFPRRIIIKSLSGFSNSFDATDAALEPSCSSRFNRHGEIEKKAASEPEKAADIKRRKANTIKIMDILINAYLLSISSFKAASLADKNIN